MSRRGLLLSLCCATVSGFAPIQTVSRSDSSLNAFNPVNGMIERATASLALGSVILSNVAVWPAIAFDQPDFGSSQIIAARSGGRAGGRSSSSAYKASPKVRAAQKAAPAPVIIRETRIVTTPSYGGGYGGGQAVMMAPQPMMMAQPGIPGLGVIAGLGAVNAIGDSIRENRQENEIRDARAQVQEARMKEAELDARLKSLERMQYPNAVSP